MRHALADLVREHRRFDALRFLADPETIPIYAACGMDRQAVLMLAREIIRHPEDNHELLKLIRRLA